MKNFVTVAQNINMQPLLDAINAQPELWNRMNLRTTHPETPHYDVDDIVIRFNMLSDNVMDMVDDKESVWYPPFFCLPVKPLIYGLMNDALGDRIGRVVITRLAPGKSIDPHVDQGSPVSYYQRFHIAIQNEEGAVFTIEDEEFTPKTGDIYAVTNDKLNSVKNNSNVDRITMIVDVRTPLLEKLKQTFPNK